MSDIPDPLQELVNAQLMDDETIQWMEQPFPVLFSEAVLLFILGVYVVQLIVFFVIFAANGTEVVFWDNLLGISTLSLMMPVACMIGAWKGIRIRCRQTIYVITNFRAIIVWNPSLILNVAILNVTSYYPKELSYVSRMQRANGTGHLYFHTESWRMERWLKGGFMNIRHVKEVERMLQELKRTKLPEGSY